MNKKTIRIGIITTAVLSVLLFILYLPVLIWSPPWGEDGYYQSIENFSFLYFYQNNGFTYGKFDDAWITIFHHNPDVGLEHTSYALDDDDLNEFRGVKISNPFTIWYITYLELMR